MQGNVDINLIYQLIFVVILMSLSLVFFVILIRYMGWLKIHLDRVTDLHKIDKRAIDSSIESLTIIAKSKGMIFTEEEYDDDNDEGNIPRGKYSEFTNI